MESKLVDIKFILNIILAAISGGVEMERNNNCLFLDSIEG